MIMGDLNGRMGQENSFISFNGVQRMSRDLVLNSQGKKLVEMCNDYGLAIVNGSMWGSRLREGRAPQTLIIA